MAWLTCPQCGSDDALLPQFPDARTCPSCAAASWAAAEPPFAENHYCGADPAGSVRTVPGDPRVVFAASGSVNYYRGDMRLPAYRFTGSAALLMGDLTGHAALAASGQATHLPVRETPERSFAEHLAAATEDGSFVFDLRGIRDRPYQVAIGTGPLPDDRTRAVADALTRACRARGLAVAVDETFGALPPWTVTSYAQTRLGLSAIQVQIVASLRAPQQHPAGAHMVFTVLRAAAAALG